MIGKHATIKNADLNSFDKTVTVVTLIVKKIIK